MPDRGSFELTDEDVGDHIRVVSLRGDADRFHVEAVGRAIQAGADAARDVVVDLSRTTFMDSSMLAALVAASEEGRRSARRLVLVVHTPRLRRSLEVKGLAQILSVTDSRESALELLAEPDAGRSASPEPG